MYLTLMEKFNIFLTNLFEMFFFSSNYWQVLIALMQNSPVMMKKSPLDLIFERSDFKPFSGKRALKILQKAKSNLSTPPFKLDDILKAVSSLGVISDNEIKLLLTLQEKICIKCGDCCRDRRLINISKNELNKIALYKNKSYKKMKQELKAIPLGDGRFRITQPCKFLKGNRCDIYNSRPSTCIRFPTSEILNYLIAREDNITCPIVDELFEEIVFKRVIEETLYKKNQSLYNENKEKLMKEILLAIDLPQSDRIKNIVQKFDL